MLVQNYISTKIKAFDENEIRVLRFFVGVLISISLAFAINWPFAFITPIFVAKFLGNKKSKLPFNKLAAVFIIIFSALILGGLATRLLLPFPIVFILITTLLIFWISYWNNSGGNELVITMLLVGFTVIPMLTLLHPSVAEVFTTGFLVSCFISILITMMMHEIIPDKVSVNLAQPSQSDILPEKPIRVKFALISTLMIMPVMIFFLYFNLGSSLLILVFIALLAQKPDLVAGVKGSKALLVGNTIGGLVAIIMYNLLKIAPNFAFLVLLFALIIIIFAKHIFSDKPLAPLYAMAFSTVIILISSD